MNSITTGQNISSCLDVEGYNHSLIELIGSDSSDDIELYRLMHEYNRSRESIRRLAEAIASAAQELKLLEEHM